MSAAPMDQERVGEGTGRPRRTRSECLRGLLGVNSEEKKLELGGIMKVLENYTETEGGINCSQCGKLYKSKVCLTKHLWEHSVYWDQFDGVKNHERVLSIQAAIIMYMNNGLDKDRQTLNSLLVTSPHLMEKKTQDVNNNNTPSDQENLTPNVLTTPKKAKVRVIPRTPIKKSPKIVGLAEPKLKQTVLSFPIKKGTLRQHAKGMPKAVRAESPFVMSVPGLLPKLVIDEDAALEMPSNAIRRSSPKAVVPQLPSKPVCSATPAEEKELKNLSKKQEAVTLFQKRVPNTPSKEKGPKTTNKYQEPKTTSKEKVKIPAEEKVQKERSKEIGLEALLKGKRLKTPSKDAGPKISKRMGPKMPYKEPKTMNSDRWLKTPAKEKGPKPPYSERGPKAPRKIATPKSVVEEHAQKLASRQIFPKAPLNFEQNFSPEIARAGFYQNLFNQALADPTNTRNPSDLQSYPCNVSLHHPVPDPFTNSFLRRPVPQNCQQIPTNYSMMPENPAASTHRMSTDPAFLALFNAVFQKKIPTVPEEESPSSLPELQTLSENPELLTPPRTPSKPLILRRPNKPKSLQTPTKRKTTPQCSSPTLQNSAPRDFDELENDMSPSKSARQM